jgi:hypothetical protein
MDYEFAHIRAPLSTSYDEADPEDIKKIIRDTAEQFFIGDPEVLTEQRRFDLAGELISSVLVPMNRQYAMLSLNGDIVIADLSSLKPPTDSALKEAWDPQSMPACMSVAGFKTLKAGQMCGIYAGKKYTAQEAASVWLKWRYRRIYQRGFIFAPNVKQDAMTHHFNTWHGWGIKVDLTEPAHPERWEALRNHIQECYFNGNDRHYTWFMAWLADMFKNPMQKPGSAVVIRGVKGSGKTLIADVMKELIGKRYFQRLDKPEQLTGQFNGHFLSAILVNVEEAFFSGDKKAEGALKSMITSDDLHYRLMHTNGFNGRNYSRFLFTSNEKWVVPATFDDRRWFPIECSSKYARNKPYFNMIWAQLKHTGGYEELMKYLLTFEAPEWVDLRNPPVTEELARQVEAGFTIPERFFWNAVKTGDGFPCEEGGEFYNSNIYEEYREWCLKYKDTWAATNQTMFAGHLKKFWLAEKKPGRITDKLTRKKETVYKIPSLDEVREHLTLEFSLPGDMFDDDCADEAEAEE